LKPEEVKALASCFVNRCEQAFVDNPQGPQLRVFERGGRWYAGVILRICRDIDTSVVLVVLSEHLQLEVVEEIKRMRPGVDVVTIARSVRVRVSSFVARLESGVLLCLTGRQAGFLQSLLVTLPVSAIPLALSRTTESAAGN
jgi:hypothetical protein